MDLLEGLRYRGVSIGSRELVGLFANNGGRKLS